MSVLLLAPISLGDQVYDLSGDRSCSLVAATTKRAACVQGRTFGCVLRETGTGSQLWVSGACRGVFYCGGQPTSCYEQHSKPCSPGGTPPGRVTACCNCTVADKDPMRCNKRASIKGSWTGELLESYARERRPSDAYCALEQSTSQWCEDVLLLPTLLRAAPATGGTFVELGALDGRLFSNTVMLEKCFGWSGLLIEPNVINFNGLNRSGRSARRVHSGVCGTPGIIQMTVAGGAMAADQERMMGRLRRMHAGAPTARVPCAPLSALMRDAGLESGATLLTLDVEGAEAMVLGTVDPALFQVVVVEIATFSKARDALVHDLLTKAGHVLQKELRVPKSHVYLQPSVLALPLRSVSWEDDKLYPRPTLKELRFAMADHEAGHGHGEGLVTTKVR